MNSSSPANSSISTTAVAGRCTTNAAMSIDDFRLPANLISIPERKDEAMTALRSNIMAALNKEVKSLDDDNWMFEGPRSRINRMSRKVHIRWSFPQKDRRKKKMMGQFDKNE